MPFGSHDLGRLPGVTDHRPPGLGPQRLAEGALARARHAQQEQRRIFEPFRAAGAGTGLGLAIVYRIVREHGGDISVRSAPQQGTLVEVRLPCVGAAATAEGAR